MLVANGEIRGVDININSKDDIVHPVKTFFHCSFMMAHEYVFFNRCRFFNCRGVLSVTHEGKVGTNDYNKALRIRDVEIENPDKWVIISDQVFDGCAFPVFIYGRNCEIHYDISPALREQFRSETEWNQFLKDYKEYEKCHLPRLREPNFHKTS